MLGNLWLFSGRGVIPHRRYGGVASRARERNARPSKGAVGQQIW